MTLPALASLIGIIHVLLVIQTGHSAFWWLARLLQVCECAQRATWLCLGPFWRRRVRQFAIEFRSLAPERQPSALSSGRISPAPIVAPSSGAGAGRFSLDEV